MATYSKALTTKALIQRAPIEKRYEYRVYDSFDGSFLKSWTSEVLTHPNFRMVINGGPGEMVVKLRRDFDNFGEEEDIKLFNKVKIYCYDFDAPQGILLYSGFISGYRPILSKHSEYLEVTLLHTISEMSKIMVRDGSGNTTITKNSTSPSDMFKDLIDYYRADGGVINYSASSVEETGTTVSYTFKAYNAKEALDKVVELTPERWYWRIDADEIAYLKLSNMTVADHTFIIGKHIIDMETWRRGEDLVNTIYFFGEESGDPPVAMYRYYSNTASINSYGIHSIKVVDGRVSVAATADVIAERIINTRKDPEIRTTITIADNNGPNHSRGYNIESIKPGQTMQIRNIKQGLKTVSKWDQMMWDEDVWDQTLAYQAADVIQILSVEYSPHQVRIEASSRLPEISKRIEDIQRNWEESVTANTDDAPVIA